MEDIGLFCSLWGGLGILLLGFSARQIWVEARRPLQGSALHLGVYSIFGLTGIGLIGVCIFLCLPMFSSHYSARDIVLVSYCILNGGIGLAGLFACIIQIREEFTGMFVPSVLMLIIYALGSLMSIFLLIICVFAWLTKGVYL